MTSRTVQQQTPTTAVSRSSTPASLPPSGRQYPIRHGHQNAIVVENGGGLRRFTVDGFPLFDGYPERVECPGKRGLPLLPWPDQLTQDDNTGGALAAIPATEPARRHALHGFCGTTYRWAPRHVSTSEVVLGVLLCPELGYSCTVDVTISYRLDEAGLTVRTNAVNVGERTCLWGTGHHPYLTTGVRRIDPLRLQVHAQSYVTTHRWEGVATGTADVTGSLLDFSEGPLIAQHNLDLTFTDLARGRDGRAWIALTGPDQRKVAIWLDENYRFVGVCTAHHQPPPHFRTGLVVQPMTCPPGAFRTGQGLMRLKPGEHTSAAWGINTS